MDNIHFPKAIFTAPGDELVDGEGVKSRVVTSQDELDLALADGWHETPRGALDAHQAVLDAQRKADEEAKDENRAPTRAELEQKATELGIAFKAQTSDKKLAEAIATKLAEAAQ